MHLEFFNFQVGEVHKSYLHMYRSFQNLAVKTT